LNVSSLSSPNFAASYALGSVGLVDGSLSYLYSSLPLQNTSKSGNVDLHHVIRGYQQLQELRKPDLPYMWEQWHGGRRIDKRDTLLYGRMYLPQSTLEALYLRRITPTQQIRVTAVSDSRLRNGGTLLALHQYDAGKYSMETLYSTDGGLLGVRGLYNFGPDPRKDVAQPVVPREDRLYGRFSAGAELYYGSLNKSGGVSVGGRFATLPAHTGVPLTATLTLNPLMGNFSTTYAVKAGKDLSLCSRFDFNIYSYESDLMLGCELWRYKQKLNLPKERSFEAKLAWRLDDVDIEEEEEPEVSGVLKARIDQNCKIGLLWEGRVKELLFSLGTSFDIKRRDQPFRAVGLEVQYSS
jgi:distribution and morphology protein 10